MKRAHIVLLAFALAGCEDEVRGVFDPYGDETVAVIGDGEIVVSAPVGSGECVQISESSCVPVDTSSG